MASATADTVVSCSRPEFKVRFDGQPLEEHREHNERPEDENLTLREVPLKDKQLYANEGVSRL